MKLAIISGGSKGLGEALVNEYQRQGFEVVEFSRSGDSNSTVRADFSDPEMTSTTIHSALDTLATETYEEVIAISNAGVLSPMGPLSETTAEEWVTNLNINFTSAIIFMGLFSKFFKNISCQKTLVSISSGAALKGYFGWSLYCASKAGLENFIRSIEIEQLAEKFPIRAVNVDPGIIDTSMQESIRKCSKAQFPDVERFIHYKRSGALRSPQSVAKMISFLMKNLKKGTSRYSVEKVNQPRS